MGENSVSVLLIEDNPGDALILRRMLSENRDFKLTQIEFLRQVSRCVEQERFDVVLLDLFLADSHGLETFMAVHSLLPAVPIVVLTGLDDEELGTRAVRQGAQDYLVKGQVDRNLLVRALRYAIERKRTEEKLLAYQRRLRSLAARLTVSEEQERRRIATDLHDHIGQILATARINLGLLKETADEARLGSVIDEVRALIEQAIRYTRTLTFELSSPVLYELGLSYALEALAEQLQRQFHYQVEFHDDKSDKPLDDDVRIVLFQAVRELLVNVGKHARAGKVSVSVQRLDDNICIMVDDNGVGFDVSKLRSGAAKTDGFGLFNIRERLDFLSGTMDVVSSPRQGTQVRLVAPLKRPSHVERGQMNEYQSASRG